MFRKLLEKIGSDQPTHSLIVLAWLSTYYDDYGLMGDFGLAERVDLPITRRPPRSEPGPYDPSYTTKFIKFTKGEPGMPLGRARVEEAYVYDNHYRAEIDFTGLRLVLTLNPSAFILYREFIGAARVSSWIADPTAWDGDVLLRIPSPFFDFPAPRGSAPPFPPAGATVRKLRRIKTFDFNEAEIIRVFRDSRGMKPEAHLISARPEDVLHLKRS